MYRVDVSNTGESSFTVKSKDYEFIVDTEGKGVTPPDTLLASLGTCIGVYVRKYCQGAQIPVKGFALSVQADLSHDKPARFSEITVTLDARALGLDERRADALLRFIKNCPVHHTLLSAPQVNIQLS